MNSELKRQIDEIAVECDVAGWDGYGAKVVTAEALAAACVFADALDFSLHAPKSVLSPTEY
ncbi:MAG: hypothetical protein ACREO5_03745 [Candidatus Binatia bacterium]